MWFVVLVSGLFGVYGLLFIVFVALVGCGCRCFWRIVGGFCFVCWGGCLVVWLLLLLGFWWWGAFCACVSVGVLVVFCV